MKFLSKKDFFFFFFVHVVEITPFFLFLNNLISLQRNKRGYKRIFPIFTFMAKTIVWNTRDGDDSHIITQKGPLSNIMETWKNGLCMT